MKTRISAIICLLCVFGYSDLTRAEDPYSQRVADPYAISMPARRLGKWKATIQYFAVVAALFPPTADIPWVADTALWVAVALTVVSGIDLVVSSRRDAAATGVASTT